MGDDQRSDDRADAVESSGSPEISTDQLYRALASEQRRRLLSYLLDGEERTVEEIATVLTGWQAAESGSMQTAADREQVHIELFHSHLPLLDEIGVIRYDEDRGAVEIESLDPAVESLLAEGIDSAPPRS